MILLTFDFIFDGIFGGIKQLCDQCGGSNVLGTQSAWTWFLGIFLHCIMILLIVDHIFGEIFNDKIIAHTNIYTLDTMKDNVRDQI
jgi:TM2 domain-containing membrane protein YozV